MKFIPFRRVGAIASACSALLLAVIPAASRADAPVQRFEGGVVEATLNYWLDRDTPVGTLPAALIIRRHDGGIVYPFEVYYDTKEKGTPREYQVVTSRRSIGIGKAGLVPENIFVTIDPPSHYDANGDNAVTIPFMAMTTREPPIALANAIVTVRILIPNGYELSRNPRIFDRKIAGMPEKVKITSGPKIINTTDPLHKKSVQMNISGFFATTVKSFTLEFEIKRSK